MVQPISPLPRLRVQIHVIIDGTDTRLGKGFDLLLLIAIVMSVMVVMIDSVLALQLQYGELFNVLEWVFTI